MAKKDFYEVLGVSKSASADELKRSYRKLALEWHPDRNKKPEANTKFKEINEAYAVLSDAKKKQQYDQFGHDAFAPGMGGGAGGGNPYAGWGGQQGPFSYTYSSSGGSPFGDGDFVDPFEIFEQFFGGGFSGGRSARRRRETYRITISFMDAVNGVTKEVHLPKGEAGEGSLQKTIKIPPGVDSGSRIRFDEFDILVDVSADKRFKREGSDVISDFEISYPDAVLGTIIDVPGLHGSTKLRIQPGTQPGTLIRLRGKGIPHLQGSGSGDQYVRIQMKVPSHVSRKQKEIIEALRSETLSQS